MGSVADPARMVEGVLVKSLAAPMNWAFKSGAIINASLDNASLGISGTFVKNRGGGYKSASVYTSLQPKADTISYSAASLK
jgi:hypothetical protein